MTKNDDVYGKHVEPRLVQREDVRHWKQLASDRAAAIEEQIRERGELEAEVERLKSELSECVSADAARQESAHQDGVIYELKAEVVRWRETAQANVKDVEHYRSEVERLTAALENTQADSDVFEGERDDAYREIHRIKSVIKNHVLGDAWNN